MSKKLSGNTANSLAKPFLHLGGKPAGDVLGSWTPNRSGHREMAGQWPSDPDCPVGLLVEVAFREAGLGEPCGEPTVDARANCFHRVIGEGGATSCVGVKDTEACVETDAGQRDSQFRRPRESRSPTYRRKACLSPNISTS